VKLERTYECDDEEAVARLKALTAYWGKEYGIQSTWEEGAVTLDGKVKGVRFDGRVTVGGGKIFADVKAGFLAEKLGGKAYVNRKLDDYLDPKNSLESLQARAS